MRTFKRTQEEERSDCRGAALIGILLGVALAAILVAAAAPNFTEAQLRTRTSHAQNDMRLIAAALEAYAVDEGGYPLCDRFGLAVGTPSTTFGEPVLERLTTPVAYLSTGTVFLDPYPHEFRRSGATAADLLTSLVAVPESDVQRVYNMYIYQSVNNDQRTQLQSDSFTSGGGTSLAWLLHSAGPNRAYHNLGGVLANDDEIEAPLGMVYDPTNGLVSNGCIYRTGGDAGGTPVFAAGRGLVLAIRAGEN